MKKKLIIVLIILLALIAVLCGAFFIYAADYYHASETCGAALSSDSSVTVKKTDTGYLFDGPSEDHALIFYPGAKVESTSYAPLLHRLAAEGFDVFLVDMPFNLAIFGKNKASDILNEYGSSYDQWYISGHSLGGAVASMYVAGDNGSAFEGIVFLASYPASQVPDNMACLLITGSEDTVINRKNLEDSRSLLPSSAVFHTIEGGNHARFGNYGEQKGDGKASLTPSEQQEETVRIIVEKFL